MLRIMSRTRTVLLLILINLILVLVIGAGYFGWLASNHPIRINLNFDYPTRYQPDPDNGYAHIPNLDLKLPAGTRLHTNGQGIRSDSPNAADYETADIISIGGSQTLGSTVQAEEAFPSVLGKLLGATSANLGVSGYGGVTGYTQLKKFWHLKPKVVIYGFWEDHEYRNISQCAPSWAPFCRAVPHIEFDGSEPHIVEPKSSNDLSMFLSAKYIQAVGAGRKEYPLWQDAFWVFQVELQKILWTLGLEDRYRVDTSAEQKETATRYLLSQLALETQENGAKLIVIFLPSYLGKEPLVAIPSYIPKQLQASGAYLIDMTKEFQNIIATKGRKALMVPEDKTKHMSTLAHTTIAKKAAELIKARGLLR